MHTFKIQNIIFSYSIVGMMFFGSCVRYPTEKEVMCCNADTTTYKEHAIDIENHHFTFLLPEDYFYNTSEQLPVELLMRDEDFVKAFFYSKNNKKNYFFMETTDAKYYEIDSSNFEQSRENAVKRVSYARSYAVIYSECYKTEKYKYYVTISFERSYTDRSRDTVITEFKWNVLYDGKLYWHTLHSEEHFKDFSYESKKKIINSIKIK